MSRARVSALLLAFTIALGAPKADAALLVRDLLAPGDGLITFDDQTNLEWLDVDQTVNQTYNQVAAGSFYTTHGFRHATFTELGQLYSSVGLTDSGVSYIAGNFSGGQTLLGLLGCTDRCSGSDFPVQWGLVERVPFDAANAAYGLIVLYVSASAGRVQLQDDSLSKSTYSPNGLGNYLVRQTVVPVPAALPLMGSAIACLFGACWRRRERI